ncbi:MAG: DNA cytosine methyltransferase [bacterium]
MKVIDLFSGVGGLSLGFKSAGFDVELALEKDREIADSYKLNHMEVEMINKDITDVNMNNTFSKYSNKDVIIIGGPPCQGFSQKGNRELLNDKRNFLFKFFYEVVRLVRPKYFLIENVPNILTARDGYFKDEITNLFSNLGYKIDKQILNAINFGVPQKRKRAFILGKLGKNKISLPKGNDSQIVTIRNAISDLAFLNSGEGEEVQDYKFNSSSAYQKEMRKNSKKLYNHVATNHSKKVIKRLEMIPVGKGREVLPKEHLTKSIYSGTWSRMKEDEPSVTITTRYDTPSSGRFTHPFLNRAITTREAARIQSFPDTFIFYGTKSSKMKQVGNAVPPLLAKSIANVIKMDI